ncbi:Uncharacterised protein [Candidatus Bilamarchaeum dharawalense]|uniref:Emp24/gp25L/p24 family/GOLD n=1 Tax=Candidatus Bilamarchaeum dharawalense TaxID=2885759 RepID=A0A5E4LR78_9ARCH|nr:Uncharacterised protein [Candidatus Bilamarchaeum dharawalense]
MYSHKLLGLGMLLLIFGCLQNEAVQVDETDTIPENEMHSWWVDAVEGNTIRVNMTVTGGGPVDVFFMDSNGYADYNYNLGGGVQDFIVEDQEIGVKRYNSEIKIATAGRYYFVIDNTGATEGTEPNGEVFVKIKISKK